MVSELPASLLEIRDDFLALSGNDRVLLLLEFANDLPELPERYRDHPELLERVIECQSPVYIFVEISDSGMVQVFATAPAEAPTTRGFASILVNGLSGLSADDVLSVTPDFPSMLGLTDFISLLRLRGMSGMLNRIQRQVHEKKASRD